METRSKLCLICSLNCKGTSGDLIKLREDPNFKEFLNALGEDNEDGLNTSLINLLGEGEVNCGKGFTVCEKCKELIGEAVDWKGRVVEVEEKVLRLQRELLEELGRLEEFLGEYGGKLRRIRENVRMEVVQLKFEVDDGGDRDEEHFEILEGMGNKMDGVVADLENFQDELSSKIDDKMIKKKLRKRVKFKSTEFVDDLGDSEDDPTTDKPRRSRTSIKVNFNDDDEDWHWDENDTENNQDKQLKKKDNAEDDDDDWRPPDSPEVEVASTNESKVSERLANQKRLGKYAFKNQVTRLILKRERRYASEPPNSSLIDVKYPIKYDSELDKITIAETNQILIVKDKCNVNHLQCTICDYQTPNFAKKRTPSYMSVETIYDHVIMAHYGGFNCEICGRVATSRKKFLEHQLIHKDPESFNCEICGRPLKTKESKKMHQFTHFNEEEKRREVDEGRAPWWGRDKGGEGEEEGNFICGTCGKCFGKLAKLKKHEGSHRIGVICPKCGKRVTRHWYRNYHSIYKCPLDGGEGGKRGGDGEGGKECWECGKRFVDLVILRKHMKRSHSEEARVRSWICDKCGKGYKSRGDLKTHEKVHAEGMGWWCGGCGKGFNQKKNFKRHNCKKKGAEEKNMV